MIQDNTTKWRVRKLTKAPYEIEGSLLPLGHTYFSFEPTVPTGRIPAFGGLYDRTLYADLWLYANAQGLVISETEWQSRAKDNGGNCSYYSDGNGSTTFRVPSLKCWVKGANGIDEVGSYLEAGLPNIEGETKYLSADTVWNNTPSGAFNGYISYPDIQVKNVTTTTETSAFSFVFDASRSNPIYGNSDTVQPPSLVGMWLIVAFGTVSNVGNLDMNGVASGVENIQTRLNEYEHLLQENENALTIVGYHNSIYRGKYLGDKLTSAQSATIRAGEFEDLYIGDYWTIGGVNYRIVAFDYYYNCGDTACTTHHVVVVPDTVLYNAQMNTENVTTGAYVGSAMYTTNLAQAKTTIANAFGTDHLLTIRQHFQNAVTNGYTTGGTWYDAVVWLMNEINVYGCKVFGDCIQGTNWANRYYIDNTQYPLFAMNPRMIHTRQTYWLRDVANSTYFACVGGAGYCGYSYSSYSGGVRPAFLVY